MGSDPDATAAEPFDALTTRTLGGFVLQKKVGAGGFGDVYLAEQLALKREAVVKVLRPDEMTDDRVQRFLREAQLASHLDHPYASHIYAFGAEPDGILWIAMEWVRGASLRALLEAQGPMSLDRFVPLLERICEVVHTAHDQAIVHRDLKPDNIMVISRAGRSLPKLLDFGIARAMNDAQILVPGVGPIDDQLDKPVTVSTERGAVLGSPPYMAPELWVDAHTAGPPADQYALAAVAFEALTGRLAFTGKTMREVARAHAGKIPSLGDGAGELDLVLLKATARAPADRYGNVLEFAQAFRAASGIASPAVELPKLDDELRAQFLIGAPQPLADAVVEYDAARNAHQARDALRGLVKTAAWYVGVVALACRTRVGSGGATDSDHARQLLRDLRRHGLTSGEWIALARQLTQPFARSPDTYPLPELAMLLHPRDRRPDAFSPALEGTLSEALAGSSEDVATQAIARELPVVTVLLRALAFLLDYQLVVPREPSGDGVVGRAESWMGTRSGAKPTIAMLRELPTGRPVLTDAEGHPLLALWPLVQVHAAIPGHGDQLFLLAGPGRQGARLVSPSHSFERHDPALWDWFRDQVFSEETAAGGALVDESPYRGLSSYSAGDAGWFFGREREIDALINRLKVEPFVAVVGPSGVGKSSFVHAGVVPSLAGWRVITLRPGRAPMAQLAVALEHAGVGPSPADEDLPALAARCRAWAADVTGAAIVVDQFEEVFTLGAPAAERDRFVRALFAIARSIRDPIRVVITMRDDFLIRAEQLPGFGDALARGLQLLGPLGPEALERVLIEPARRVGYEFEDPTLPARMVADTAGTPAAVALISFTATRLWELRDRHFHQLPSKAYDALGGVAGALARHADETVEAMPIGERALVRAAFRHLVTFEGTRAVLDREELEMLLGGGDDASRLVERLITARLIVSSENEAGKMAVEIIHEALVAAWPRLAEWRREDVEGSRFHEQLRAAAKQWDDRRRPGGLLWRGDALAEYQRWRMRHVGNLTPLEAAFGAASVADARRGRNIRRTLIGVAIAITTVFVIVLLRANGEAKAQATRAELLLRDSDFEQGRLLTIEGEKLKALPELVTAYRMGETGSMIRIMIEEILRSARGRRRDFHAHTEKLRDLVYSADGALIATASDDHTAQIWNPDTGVVAGVIHHDDAVGSVAFSPDGHWLASASDDKTVRLWDVTKNRAGPVLTMDQPAYRVVFSPDSARVLATGRLGGIQLWTVAGAHVGTLAGHKKDAVAAFCASGNCIVSSDMSGAVVLWDAHTLTPRMRFDAVTPVFSAPAVDRDGTTIAIGNGAGELILIRADGSLIAKRQGHRQSILSTVMSPDGATVVTAAEDGVAKLWETSSGTLRAEMHGHRSAILSARFSPRGDLLATAGADGTTRIWSGAGALLGELVGHTNSVVAVAFRPDGHQLASASWDRHAFVWDIAAALQFRALEPGWIDEESHAPMATYSADNKHFALNALDGALVLTDLTTNTTCRADQEHVISELVWNPDGATIATISVDENVIRIWRASTCELVRTLTGHTGIVRGIAFGDDLTLISGSSDRTVRVWDLASGRERTKLGGYAADVEAVGFLDATRIYAMVAVADHRAAVVIDQLGSDRRQILTAGAKEFGAVIHDPVRHRVLASGTDHFVSIWDDTTGKLLHRLESSGDLRSVALSPDGALIVAVGGVSPTVWNADTFEQLGSLEGHLDVVWWGGFIGDRGFVTVGRDHVARVWDLINLRPTQVIDDAWALAISPDRGSVVLITAAAASDARGSTRIWHPSAPVPDLSYADTLRSR